MAARRAHSEPPANHVGYYLIDAGRQELERLLRYRPKLHDAALNVVLGYPRLVYFGGLAVVAALALGALASYAAWQTVVQPGAVAVILAVVAVLVALAPAGDIAVSLVNYWLSSFLPPRVLPKLDFKEGIPADCATFVVMPTHADAAAQRRGAAGTSGDPLPRQSRPAAALRPADRLRRRADRTHAGGRRDRARRAGRRPRRSNERYADGGPDRFFLFHRRRQWNPAEGCWMGWERKRGKLAEFNRLLRGARDTSYTVQQRRSRAGCRAFATSSRSTPIRSCRATRPAGWSPPWPIRSTGRASTRGGPRRRRLRRAAAARQLHAAGVRKLALRPHLRRLGGIDPYTTAVSDVYQDLFGAGSFTGKGIYDVDAFEAAAGRTFPDNHILSHDLIEGNYARCGLVTDIELLDDFPASYHAYARREHRWVRGDWQLLPWLFARPDAWPRGRRRRGAMATSSDPIRCRSWSAGRSSTTCAAAWCRRPWCCCWSWAGRCCPARRGLWTASALVVLVLPLLLQVGRHPGSLRAGPSLAGSEAQSAFPSGLATTAAQVLLSATFLAEQADLLADAIGPHAGPAVRHAPPPAGMGDGGRRRAAAGERAGDVPARSCGRRRPWPSLLAFGLFARPARQSSRRPGRSWSRGCSSPLVAFWVSRPPRGRGADR